MDREADVLQDRVEVLPFQRRRIERARTGLEVRRMKRRKAAAIQPCTASTRARSARGQVAAESRDQRAEAASRISTQRSIEPSWFPQTPVTL